MSLCLRLSGCSGSAGGGGGVCIFLSSSRLLCAESIKSSVSIDDVVDQWGDDYQNEQED